MSLALAFLLTLAAHAGCGSDPTDEPADAGPIDIGDLTFSACTPEQRIGGFTVELHDGFSSAGGNVSDSVNPIGLLETISEAGSCRHARAAVPFCDPACSGGEICGTDSQCRDAPVRKSAGTVTIRGLATLVSMDPVAPRQEYSNSGTLPHPVVSAGDGVALDSSGGDFGPFSIRGVGVSSLAIAAQTIPVAAGAPVSLSWEPPSVNTPTKVSIELNINLHGTAGSRIECEVPDTGSFEIPEAMVTTLVNDGLSGFPSVSLLRSSADKVEFSEGCIDFRVQSQTTLSVEVPGLESCSLDEDCTVVGETCQPDLTCG